MILCGLFFRFARGRIVSGLYLRLKRDSLLRLTSDLIISAFTGYGEETYTDVC